MQDNKLWEKHPKHQHLVELQIVNYKLDICL